MSKNRKSLTANRDIKQIEGGITAPAGFRAAGICCGIKKKEKDLVLLYSETPASVGALFTKSSVKAAPVRISQRQVSRGKAQAVIINSGNANACTGAQGEEDARKMACRTAEKLGIDPGLVLVASTGTIGIPLPMEKIRKGIDSVVSRLDAKNHGDAAQAIMTTDTVAKEIAVECKIRGAKTVIGGMAKGSGMIYPNMATMLAFITTDADIEPACLQKMLSRAVNQSFHLITVDGDRSTNDMVVAMANGMAGGVKLRNGDTGLSIFQDALNHVTVTLAKMIARDGEGATKFVEIRVTGALTADEGKAIAFSVANSNLLKVALYSGSPNWGRIMAAIGAAERNVDEHKIGIAVNGMKIVEEGCACRDLDAACLRDLMKKDEVLIEIDLNRGKNEAVAWTCDLSHKYIDINMSSSLFDTRASIKRLQKNHQGVG